MVLDIKQMKKFVENNDIENQLYVSAKYLIKKEDFDLRIKGTDSYTDLKDITIGYPLFSKPTNEEELFIIFMALMGHESQHMLSSSITEMDKIIEKVKKDFEKKKISERTAKKVSHFILNSLEDGRIENILVNNKKGFLKHMKYLNYKMYINSKMQKSELYDFLNSILVYTKTGLLPKWFNEYENTKLEKEFNKIRDDIDEAVYARTCKDCMQIGYRIITKTKDYLSDLIEEKDIDEDKLMPQGTFNSDNEKEFNDNNKNSSRINDMISDKEDKGRKNEDIGNNKKDSGNKDDKKSNNNEKGGKNKEEEKLDKKKDNEGFNDIEEDKKDKENNNNNNNNSNSNNNNNKIDEELKKAFNEVFDELAKDTQEKLENYRKNKELEEKEKQKEKDKEVKFQLTGEDIQDIMNYYNKTDFVNLNVEKVEINKNSQIPQKYKNKANKFRREIIEILDEKKKPIKRNQRNGLLDTRNLYKFVAFNNNDIFVKKQNFKEFSSVFYFLVDGSGSMYGDNKWNYAMETMLILEEALKGIVEIKIAVFNVGGYSDNNVYHRIVKDFEDIEQNYSYNSYVTQTIKPGGRNKDGLNIRVATKELEKRPERQKILFILSDGLPTAYRNGEIAIDDVKEAVKEARSKNIEVISIMFGDKDFRMYCFELYKKMYEKNIISTEPEKILKRTIRILKNIFAS